MVTGPPEARIRRVKETWRAVSKVFLMAVAFDLIYQWLALPRIYPMESIVTATILAILPYVVLRGLTTRIARWRASKQAGRSGKMMAILLAACLGIGAGNAHAQGSSTAQDKTKEPPKLGWSNSADLSVVFTAGNSVTRTWAFTNLLRYAWKDARFESEVNVDSLQHVR
jgi:hypothetical protein